MPPTPKPIPVGTRVRFRLGAREITGTIVEDLGLIGVGRRRIVRVEVPIDSTYLKQFDVPAEELKPIQPRHRRSARARADTLNS